MVQRIGSGGEPELQAEGRQQHHHDAHRGDQSLPRRRDPPHGHHGPPHHILQVKDDIVRTKKIAFDLSLEDFASRWV